MKTNLAWALMVAVAACGGSSSKGDGGTTIDAPPGQPDAPPTADAVQEIIMIPQPFSNHNGGDINFGPDGELYIGMGDGGSGGDPIGNGQNTNALLAKMLRLDVDHPAGGKNYGIPAGNVFAGGGGA